MMISGGAKTGVTPCALGGDVQQRGSVVTDNVFIRVAGVEARAAFYTPCGGSREAPGWLGRVSGTVTGLCRAHCLRSWLAGVDQPAQRLRAAGQEAVYAYRFDWDDGGGFLWTDTAQLLGAAHVLELPFLFNDFSQLGSISKTLFKEQTAAERQELAAAMGRYWSTFARHGDPSGAAAGEWPRYGDEARYLRLDVRSDGGLSVRAGAESFEKILADFQADPRLDQAERCRIVVSMARWRFAKAYQPRAARATDCP